MITSPLRYPGGKARLTVAISEVIRENNLFSKAYCEPYAGGAGLAVRLLTEGFVPSIRLNDLDRAIYSFWRNVFLDSSRLCARIRDCELSVEEWRRQREIYRNPDANEFDLGFAAFYLNRTSRSGIIDGSGPIGGNEQNGNWKIDARFNRKAMIENILNLAPFVDQVEISNLDALEFLDKVLDDMECFTYLDPPYYVKGQKLYKNYYEHSDHVAIRDRLELSPHGNWLVSYDDVKEIRSLYKGRDPFNYQLTYSAGPVAKGSEVIYTSDAIRLPTIIEIAA